MSTSDKTDIQLPSRDDIYAAYQKGEPAILELFDQVKLQAETLSKRLKNQA